MQNADDENDNYSIIDDEQKEKALAITATASLMIESELDPVATIFAPDNRDCYIEEQYYIIQNRSTENGSHITIKAKDGLLLIEMFNGKLIIAEGIEPEDVEYWNHLEQIISGTVQYDEEE